MAALRLEWCDVQNIQADVGRPLTEHERIEQQTKLIDSKASPSAPQSYGKGTVAMPMT